MGAADVGGPCKARARALFFYQATVNTPAMVPAKDFWSFVVYYIGPKAPAGKEANWVQSVPSKGWFGIFRLYGPLEPWFDKTWRPGDIEEVK